MWKENMTLAMYLEQLQFVIAGLIYCLVYIVFIFKKKAVVTTFDIMQTDFIEWSLKSRMDPNEMYEKNVRMVKRFVGIIIAATFFISFGPLITTIYDLGELPLSHQSHWPVNWPEVRI